jgi:DNA-binding transcriptional LysR family regulator
MTLQQLRYVIDIAEIGSLSAAAKRLFISQPSLSAAIKGIEDRVGITIFLRNNRGVVLTTEGQ